MYDLQHDDARFRLLIDAVTDYAIYMLDRDGHVVSWNPGAQRFKGYEQAEILGQHFSRFYTEEDRAIDFPKYALETAAREGRFEAEGWRVRKDGTRFWAHVVIDPIRDPSGELIGYAKITRDLTAKRQAQEALRQSEERFRLLVESVADYAIYMLDPTGIVSSWNLGAQRFKGYAADEIIGQHFSRFYTEEDKAIDFPRHALATAEREGRFEAEGWRVRKDGTRFWAHVVIDSIRADDGRLLGFAKITRDLTERMESQRALEQAREAFFQAQKIEAVGQLTGGIAHDFNNLLMAILGSLELVRRRVPDDPRILRLIDNAHQAAQRGASLTQRMLAFARRQELSLAPVDVPELVRGMADLLQRSLGPTIAIETRFPLALAPIMADDNQLELAILNLAMNARDAMPEGGPIVISAQEEMIESGHASGLEPGHYVCLCVADQGEGMNEEVRARATEPFFTTKGVGKGTGLGLSMVHGLAEQSGGRLAIVSEAGVGTTIQLWLPVAQVNREAARTFQPHPHEAAAPRTGSLHVLAVDDDALVLLNTAAMLEDLGHIVYPAGSGAEALQILATNPVDLLITDFAMPRMNGVELAEAARVEQPDLPVLIATGYAELAAGAHVDLPRLAKPFTQSDLALAVAQTVDPDAAGGRVIPFRAR
ncbi:MAG TPA: PAS domain S-box protein [Allosphingosinicella sp.]